MYRKLSVAKKYRECGLKKILFLFSFFILLNSKVSAFQSQFAPNVEQTIIVPGVSLEQLLLPRISASKNFNCGYGYSAGDIGGERGSQGPIVFGGLIDQKDRHGLRGYRAPFGGFAFAMDTPICPIGKLGVGATGTTMGLKPGVQSKVGFGNDIDITQIQLLAYATIEYYRLFIDGMASSGYNGYVSKRNIPALGTTANATFGGIQTNTELRAGFVIPISVYLEITPMVWMKTVQLHQTQYNEHNGGAGNLIVLGQKTQLAQWAAGARFAETSEAELFYPEIHAFYLQDKTRPTMQLSAAFVNPTAAVAAGIPFANLANNPFTTLGLTPDSKAVNLGGSISALLREGMLLTAGYDVILRTEYMFQYGWIRIRWVY